MSDQIDSTDKACLRDFIEGDKEKAERLLQVKQPTLLKDEKHGAGPG